MTTSTGLFSRDAFLGGANVGCAFIVASFQEASGTWTVFPIIYRCIFKMLPNCPEEQKLGRRNSLRV